MSTVLFSDNFNRANGGLGANWTACGDAALTISSNEAQSGTGAGVYYGADWNADTYDVSRSQYISANVSPPNAGHAGVALWSTWGFDPGVSGDGYYLKVDNSNFGIYKVSEGVIAGTAIAEQANGGPGVYQLAWGASGYLGVYKDSALMLEVSPTPPAVTNLTYTHNSTASSTPSFNYPAYSTGDLVVFGINTDGWTYITPPASGPNGETITLLFDSFSRSVQGVQTVQPTTTVGYYIATSTRTTGSLSFSLETGSTPRSTVSEESVIDCFRVPAGTFNPDAPFQNFDESSTNANMSSPLWLSSPEMIAGETGGGLVVAFGGQRDDSNLGWNSTPPSGWGFERTPTAGTQVSSFLATRNALSKSNEYLFGGTFVSNSTTSTGTIIAVIIAPVGVAPTVGGLLTYSNSASVAASFDDVMGGSLTNAINIDQAPTGWDTYEQNQWLAVHPITNALWRGRYVPSNDSIQFDYSTDYGASWTNAPSLTLASREDLTTDYRTFAFTIDYQGVGYLAVADLSANQYFAAYATGVPAPDTATSMSSTSTWAYLITSSTSIGTGGDAVRLRSKVMKSAGNRKGYFLLVADLDVGSNGIYKVYEQAWQNASVTLSFSNWLNVNTYSTDSVLTAGAWDFDVEPYRSESRYPWLMIVAIQNTRSLYHYSYPGDSSAYLLATGSFGNGVIASGTVPNATTLGTDCCAVSILGSTALVAWVMNDPTQVEMTIGGLNTSFQTYDSTVVVPALNDGNITNLRILSDSFDKVWRVYVTTTNGNLHVIAVDGFGGGASGWRTVEYGNISTERDSLAVPNSLMATGLVPLGYTEGQFGAGVVVSDNFNNIADGNFLSGDPNWTSSLTSGDRMQSDRHADTDDGTQVIDASGQQAVTEFAVYQTSLATKEQSVEIDVFPDTEGNFIGVMARVQSTPGSNCYIARFDVGNSKVALLKRVSNVETELESWSYTPDTTTVYSLKLTCYGSQLRVLVNGIQRISRLDSSVGTGNYAGLYFRRASAGTNGQPWVDNFVAQALSVVDYNVLTVDTNQFDVVPVTILTEIQGTYAPYAMWGTRHVDVAPGGMVWVWVYDYYGVGGHRLYSSTDGITFVPATNNYTATGVTNYNGDLFVDWLGRAWVCAGNGSQQYTFFWVGPFSTPAALSYSGLPNYPFHCRSTVVFEDPEGQGYIIACAIQYYNSSTIYVCSAVYDNSHTYVTGTQRINSVTGIAYSFSSVSLDFQHTGDGKTATSTPHLYLSHFHDGVGTKLSVWNYDGSAARYASGAPQTTVNLDNVDMSQYDRIASYYDGTRVVTAWTDNTDHGEIQLAEWVSGSPTSRTVPTLNQGDIGVTTASGMTLSHDEAGNIIIGVSDATTKDVWIVMYDRANDSWSSWSSIPANVHSVNNGDTQLSASRRIQETRNVIPFVWANNSFAPYSIAYTEYSVDTPPDTPVLNAPSSGNAEIGEALVFQWTFSDSNGTDYQSAYALKRVVGAVTDYWNETSQTWEASEQKNFTTFTTTFLPAGWATASATTQSFSVKVWDSTDLESGYGTAVVLTPSTRHDPTIVDPVNELSFLPTDTAITVNWTVTSQSQYRIQFYNAETGVLEHDTNWVVNSAHRTYNVPVTLLQETRYSINLQTIGTTSTPAFSFPSLVAAVEIYTRRGYVAPGAPDRAEIIVKPRTRIIRYADIYESDGVTIWKNRVAVVDGSVSMQGPILRRSFSLVLANTLSEDHTGDFDVNPDGGLWYDKVIKIYRGVEYENEEFVWPLGVFHVDTISDLHWPETVTINGRDRYKVLENSKFTQPTQFSAEYDVWAVVRAIATNGGITEMSLPADIIPLEVDVLFEQNTSRADAIAQLVEAIGYTTHFDASGVFIAQPMPDPYAGAPEFVFNTGYESASGNMVSWSRRASDSELFNRVIVIGESSSGLSVYGDAKNEDPSSPTRIERIGERTMIRTLNTVTTTQQAQEVAENFLAVSSLEQFEIDVSSVVVPWLEGGDIVEVLTEADSAQNLSPTRFMLSNVTIPLALGPMSISGRRLAIIR